MIFHRMFLINKNWRGGLLFKVLENWKILDLEVLIHSQTPQQAKGALAH